MATPQCKFWSGTTTTKDYTPDSAVTAGDVVVLSNNVWMAKEDIAASALGALHIGGVWDFTKTGGTGGDTIAVGVLVYWDDSGNVATTTAGSNKKIGIAAMAAAATDTSVKVLSIPQAV